MGLSAKPWARAWLAPRVAHGFDAAVDGCLQRELLADGSFGEGRVKPGQATEWLRVFLLTLGVEAPDLENVGSHSCKVTLLSMCA